LTLAQLTARLPALSNKKPHPLVELMELFAKSICQFMRHSTLSKGEPGRLRDHFVQGASRTAGLEDRFRLRIILPAAGFEVQGE